LQNGIVWEEGKVGEGKIDILDDPSEDGVWNLQVLFVSR
jgi:hypothetical protein